MALIYIIVFGSVFIFGLTAVAGLVWAIRSGQLRDFGAGATSIFDEDEPVGVMTDAFPEPGRNQSTTETEEGRISEE